MLRLLIDHFFIIDFRTLGYILLFILLFINDVYSSDSSKAKTIIIVGDSQRRYKWELFREKNEGIAKKIYNQIAQEKPEFVIHLGDIVADGSSKNSWNDFNEDASELLKAKIPIYPVLGNHEYFGSNKKALYNLVNNFPHLKEKTWYSLQTENLAVILLNSNFGDLTKEEELQQANWYKSELHKFQSDSSVNYIFVACHHSPYTNSRIVSANKDVQEKFVLPFFSNSKSKLFFSGHAHAYEHFLNNDRHFIVSGGGGGPRQKLETDSPKFSDLYKGNEIREFHYCKIILLNDEIKFQMIRFDTAANSFLPGEIFIIKAE